MSLWPLRASSRPEVHPPWIWMAGFSVLLHGAVFLGIWQMERHVPKRALDLTSISVHLVADAPGERTTTARPSQQDEGASPKSPRVRIRRPIPKAERKLVSIGPLETKPPERKMSNPKPAVRESVTPPPVSRPKTPHENAPFSSSATARPSGGNGGKLTAEQERYLQMLRERIEENWRAYVPQDSGVLGEVRIQIAADGRIHEFTFLKGSGKVPVDDSITRAIKKTILPPPPRSLVGQAWVLRFWPSGP